MGCTLVWLLSTAQLENDIIHLRGIVVGGLTQSLHFSIGGKAMVAYFAFGVLWLLELSSALSQFVLSYAVVLWYFTPKPKGAGPRLPLQRGLVVGLTFHLGTLALGALLLALVRPVQLLLGTTSSQARSGQNRTCEALAAVLSCCVRCYREQLEFIGKTAYIDVCISSSNYCLAAQSSVGFVASEGGKMLSLTGACFLFSAVGVAGISTLVGAAAYAMVVASTPWTAEASPTHVADPFFVALLSAAVGASIASCFTVTFEHSADALLYAYVWNRSHGHNTVQKYAPDSLALLLEYRPLERPTNAAAGSSGSGPPHLVRGRPAKGGAVLSLLNTLFEKGYVQEETEALMYH